MPGMSPDGDKYDGSARDPELPSGAFPSPLLPPPPLTTPDFSGAGNGVWREYLARIVSFCSSSTVSAPNADLLRPPTDLSVYKQPRSSEQREDRADDAPLKTDDETGTGSESRNQPPTNRHPVVPEAASNAPVLVLLDMNGTLLYRAKEPLRVSASRGAAGGAPAFVHGKPTPLQYYMRPGATEFVAAMARHPRVRLAFYTSMRGTNALPAACFLMAGGGESSEGATPEVYDRPFNAHDPNGANHWDTTRDLPLIWSTSGRVGAGFGPSNTIMVDDTPTKMRFMEAGLVVVPEYTKACVLAACGREAGTERGGFVRQVDGDQTREDGEGEGAAREQAEVMPRLTEYMCRLLQESGADVRPFIERNLFRGKAFSKPEGEGVSNAPGQATAAVANGNPGTSSIAGAVPSGAKTIAPPSSLEAAAGAKTQAATAVCYGDGMVSLSEAIQLVLTTGPLSRRWEGEPAAPVVVEEQTPTAGVATAVGGGGDFEGFGKNTEASVVAAVLGLLKGASTAAERWGLAPEERERLRVWSGVAAATSVPN